MEKSAVEPKLCATSREACKNCFWWEHPRRGKSCRAHRQVTIDGRKHIGTPSSYWCNEYSPQTHATCGDCVHWSQVKVKGKKDVCSALNLHDELGKERSTNSLFCKFFSQDHGVELASNRMNRVDGVLASFLDIKKHSSPAAIVMRNSDGSGVLVKWEPEGPGIGSWKITPVQITSNDNEELVSTRPDTMPRDPREIQFSGSVTLIHEGKKVAINSIKQAVSYIMMRTKGLHSRRHGKQSESSEDGKVATSLQDEPWGPMWPDLHERMKHLLDAGESRSDAATAVTQSFNRETPRKLNPDQTARLEAQLKVAFRNA